MKLSVALLPLLLVFSACSSNPSAGGYDEAFEADANAQDVPQDVIALLPNRILRGKLKPGTNPLEYIDSLGLGPWSNNLSQEQKYDSYFLYLDNRRMLQIRCDPGSLTLTEQDAQAIQAGYGLSSSPLWIKDPIVVGATLRQDWGQVLVHRIY